MWVHTRVYSVGVAGQWKDGRVELVNLQTARLSVRPGFLARMRHMARYSLAIASSSCDGTILMAEYPNGKQIILAIGEGDLAMKVIVRAIEAGYSYVDLLQIDDPVDVDSQQRIRLRGEMEHQQMG